jgi:hypothetical protein
MLTRSRYLLAAIVLASVLSPLKALAFDFHLFGKKAKNDPAERVPTLILQLKTDPDEGKRQAAAEELRQYDPKSFPEMMTVLADALLRDSSPAVRTEAASTIGKLRPVSQAAGYALEQAKANDAAMRVRRAAQNSLLQYHFVGYRGGKPAESQPGPAGEPVTTQANRLPTAQPPVKGSPRGSRNESAEPPLAGVPIVSGSPHSGSPQADGPRPLPTGQPTPQRLQPYGPALTPVSTPKLLTPPATSIPPAPKAPATAPAQSGDPRGVGTPSQPTPPAGEGPALTPPE